MATDLPPNISVLLPVFNGERYLDQCVTSVLQQRFSDFELLIGDNCSTDSTAEIARRFSDPRIRYFRRDRNLGLFGNLNHLIKASRAPLIRFLCHDDLLEPHCLEEETQFAATHTDVGMFFCKTVRIDENGKEIGRCILGDLPDIIPPLVCLQLFFYYGCIPGNLSTVCVRRDVLDEGGLFNEGYLMAGDFELWTRICRKKTLGVIHQHLIRLRSHPEQMGQPPASGVYFVKECRRIRSELLPLLPSEIRFHAKLYSILRFSVLDVHHAMRCLWEGRFRDFLTVARTIGLLNYFPLGILCWFFTLNNHLFRPSPKYVD